jgi:ribosomal-protein-alanine N-acetyltransferase
MATILETPRLSLREMDEADLPFLTRLLGDPEVMRFFPKPLEPEEARAWYEKVRGFYASAGHSFWLAEEKPTGSPVGQVGLLPKEINGRPEVELAYMLDESRWGRGYATEAARACLQYGFGTLGLGRIVCMIRPVNTPSLAVAARLGLLRCGETEHMGLHHLLFEARRPG